MTNPEAKFALFSATNQNGGEPQTRDAWKEVAHIYSSNTPTSRNAEMHTELVLLLPLPQSWHDLCRLQVCALDGGISHSVKLFGEPILSATNEASSNHPDKT